LKELVPHVALGTDIIVGFPSETDEDFEETLTCMKQIGFSTAFMFAYSPRKGTPSFRWPDDVQDKIKATRLQRLIEVQNNVQCDQMHALLGQTLEVLVEDVSPKDETMLKGTTRSWKNAVFPGDRSLIGTLQHIKIDTYSHQTCVGKIVPAP
jgi:tRNA-2-methylthio-N6-dimethylallyladenosine synthase